MHWLTTRYLIELDRPRVMGIVNVTPDSFSDGGNYDGPDAAMAHCERLVAEGADILDVGGESSRPSAEPLPLEEERRRVLPVLKAALSLGIPVSIDTCKPDLMREALDLGVDIVNDIAALRLPGALDVVAAHPNCGICLMHMRGTPRSMQDDPHYGDVVVEVGDFLRDRAQRVRSAGVDPARIVLDPGIGFGKSVAHNLALLARQSELLDFGYPLLLGWSRKSTLGQVTGRPVADRLVASVAAGLAAVQHGAKVLRVHDVGAMVDALKVWRAAGLSA